MEMTEQAGQRLAEEMMKDPAIKHVLRKKVFEAVEAQAKQIATEHAKEFRQELHEFLTLKKAELFQKVANEVEKSFGSSSQRVDEIRAVVLRKVEQMREVEIQGLVRSSVMDFVRSKIGQAKLVFDLEPLLPKPNEFEDD